MGKGTQCGNVVRDYGYVHLSAGDLLRAERERPGSEFGELIEQYIRDGLIVPMEITVKLLQQAMDRHAADTKFLVDGFPRKMDQAIEFERVICPSAMVLYFDCTEDTMLTRLMKRSETSGRADGTFLFIMCKFRG